MRQHEVAIYKPGEPMQDVRPSAHRIKTIREPDGKLVGFGVTAPGGQVIVTRHASMMAALAKLNQTCDYIYGPMWRPREEVR